MFDVLIVGGGVIGATVMRELSRYELDVCMLERCGDVCMGQSKANSGIVHAGFDAKEGSLKAKFNVLGSRMMEAYARELGVKYVKNGSIVVAFSDEEMDTLLALKKRGEVNGVEGLSIIDRAELRGREPNISKNAVGALVAESGAIICPYELTISACGNAMDNGAKLLTDFEVCSIMREKEGFLVKSTRGDSVFGRVIINCAGLGSGKIASLVGDDYFTVNGRKGEYVLLDRESGGFVSSTLFFTPTKAGKGVLVTQTVDGNLLVGPSSEEVDSPSAITTQEGLDGVIAKAKEMCENIPFYNTITSFCGVRAYSSRHDFIIEESRSCKGVIHCAGIESPGLTSAPAIAKYVVEELVSKLLILREKGDFNPYRKPDYFFKSLTVEEKNELIAKDPSYGKIVCRCEQITEGEIVRAIRENPPARDIDAIKRRTRSGMGRCQGGFCQPYVAEILARELGVEIEDVTKFGGASNLLLRRTK